MTDRDDGPANGERGARIAPLAVAGFVLFVVSWFVPVVPQQANIADLRDFAREHAATPVPADAGLFHGPDWLPGWVACRSAWDMLVDDHTPGGSRGWIRRVVGATCLTNLVMLGAIAAVLARRRRPAPRTLGAVLLGCAALDGCWVYLDGFRSVDSFGLGYWMWLGSFVLVGLGLRRG